MTLPLPPGCNDPVMRAYCEACYGRATCGECSRESSSPPPSSFPRELTVNLRHGPPVWPEDPDFRPYIWDLPEDAICR